MTADRVWLEGLVVDAPIGVYAHEKGVLQRLEFDIAVDTDIRTAAAQDAINLAVDYQALARAAQEIASEGHHELIETVAERVARRVLLEQGPKIQGVFVRVSKPGAVPGSRTSKVEIYRTGRT